MGHLRQRTKGRWQITIHNGFNGGVANRYHETIQGTKTDALRRMRELEAGLDKGVPLPDGQITVAEHLNNWLDGYARTTCTLRTIDGYKNILDNHLIPALGHIKLRDLQPKAIQAYYAKKIERLAASSVRHHHRVLSQSLKYAVRQGYLGRNPAELVDPPSLRRKVMRTLTPDEVEVLLEHATDSQFYPVIYTAISTGMRQAELLGLRWRDVDLDLLSISVNQVLYKRRGVCIFKEPKTSGSSRRVAMTPKLALFLREYRAEREALYWQLGVLLTIDDLIFTNHDGKPVDPSYLTHSFGKIVSQAGLGRVRFHDLRHTFASIMLMRGAKPKVISEALGHASVAFTMDTYSHIISGMQEEAMALLDEVLPSGTCQTSGKRQTGQPQI